MSEVWIVETGVYEQGYIVGVYASLDAAVADVRAAFSTPYVVSWDGPTCERDDVYALTAHHECVPGLAVGRVERYDITRYPVKAA